MIVDSIAVSVFVVLVELTIIKKIFLIEFDKYQKDIYGETSTLVHSNVATKCHFGKDTNSAGPFFSIC